MAGGPQREDVACAAPAFRDEDGRLVGITEPRSGTVKHLYAVSGNRCAFPGCPTPICDESGVIAGRICHIKAHKPRGPRHDDRQTDEERQGFENLILMCPTHHDLIDDPLMLGEFTVQRLLEMKATHEAGALPEDATDEIVRALLSNSGFIVDVRQSSGDGGTNIVASGGVVVVQGLSYADARKVLEDNFADNALKLRNVAQEAARERVDALVQAFIGRLVEAGGGLPGTFADPDMLQVLLDAQRHAARSGSQDLCDVLVDLLVHRARSPTRDLLRIVLDEAIATAGRLTSGQFDALALVFELKYVRCLWVRGVGDLGRYLRTHVGPLLATASDSDASFRHLEYTGCAVYDIAPVRLPAILVLQRLVPVDIN